MHRLMVVDDIYNETPEPFSEAQRIGCYMFHFKPRMWELTVHGECRVTGKNRGTPSQVIDPK
jgi:hypothetical protein